MKICVVGLGLIGGSLCMSLHRAGYGVDGWNRSPAPAAYALENGIIDAVADGFACYDVVFVALPPRAAVNFINGASFKDGAVVADICGVKGFIEREIYSAPRNFYYVGTHPMAGKEVSGIRNSHLVEFTPANFIITPTDRNTPEGIAFARRLAAALGFAHVSVLTPEEHDRMIGYVSQLTHAIAVSLMCASDNSHLNEYTGDSFRDLTRIARINPTMWSELFLRNRDNLTAEIDQFTAALEQLRGYLAAGDAAGLEAMFRLSSQRRAAFDKKPEV